MKNELRDYILKNYEKPIEHTSLKQHVYKSRGLFASSLCDEERINTQDLNTYINDNKNKYNDFQTTLFQMIDSRLLKDSDVYNKAYLDRRLFSKIRNDKSYHPSKETIIQLGLAMELNENDMEKLLDSASYSLAKNNYFDLIIRFCVINGVYNILDVNELLSEYNCKLLSY